MEFHERPRFPRGYRCASVNCGLKQSGRDLSVFVSDAPASAAAVFTQNRFPGAPVVRGRAIIAAGRLRAIAVNSKVSNVATGAAGLDAADRMARAAGRALDVPAEQVLVSSTGVIGVPLPIDRIERGLHDIAALLQDDPMVGAEGMMTTDTHPKALSLGIGNATLTLVAKGSGMIEPNLATMLVYIFTDAELHADALHRMLLGAVGPSFNMLSIDTDTSTSDTVAILANGLAGRVDDDEFRAALLAACIRMAEILARDGEGATKLLRATVRGAASAKDARRIAKAIVNSPLVKTMAHGADPNVGRLLMAVGKCFDCTIDPARTGARINGTPVVDLGVRVDFDEPALRASLAGDTIDLDIALGVGEHEATAYGCDLTAGYVAENAAYYSS
jgi:glutamate N-acetyltransferase / amino-acid N-acetyltransferase